MDILIHVLIVFAVIVLAYFALSALYFLLFSVASLLYRERDRALPGKKQKQRLAVLLPAYKEDAVILESAQAAISHSSVSTEMSIYVIADSLQPDTLEKLRHIGVELVVVSFEKSTKVKSLRQALKQLPDNTDAIVVLDADNIMHDGFVDEIIRRLNQGFRVVQGHRTYKNINTPMAVLDSISEEVNNSIFRMGHRVMGLSASLIGSGFGCEYRLFKELIDASVAVGGFDKELEVMLLERGITIAYARRAVVFDEKVQQEDVFVNQRRRWLSAQFVYLRKNMGKALYNLFAKGNIDLFDKVVQFMLPPRVIALGVSFLFFGGHTVFYVAGAAGWNQFFAAAWSAVFAAACLSVILAIPRKLYNRNMAKALLALPGGFFLTISALIRSRGANKTFIHTRHGVSDQDTPVKE